MIKQFLLFLTISLLSFHTQAQSDFKSEWNFGLGLGPTFSNMSIIPTNVQNSLKTKSLTQFTLGLSARYITERHLGIIGELNFSQQGWESEFDAGSEYEHKHKLNYLEIPLLTHIYFGSNKTRVFVNLGPKLGYLLSETETRNSALDAAQEIEASKTSSDPKWKSYTKLAENKIDYGILGGLGMEIRTGAGNFAIEGRYYLGFGDIYKNSKKEPFSRAANRVLSVRLTYFVKAF